MSAGEQPEVLWSPSGEWIEATELHRFAAAAGFAHASYDELWRWSVNDLEGFWSSVWRHFGVRADGDPSRVLAARAMPGARWFPGVELSFAEHVLAGRDDAALALQHATELAPPTPMTWGELRDETARVRAGLQRLGVQRGDRVAACLPNVPATVAAFLATASLGAIWSCASPEMGVATLADRFGQIGPKVLLAVDGYRFGGREFDRRDALRELGAQMGARTVQLSHLGGEGWEPGFADERGELAFERVPFDHPLWILYSSGTTGPPKAIAHGHGGILLEHLKTTHLHLDARPGDRVFWFTTTGWMMWNLLIGVLLTDASIVLYDGSPAQPTSDGLWDLVDAAGATHAGLGAGYITACAKAGARPGARLELRALRAVGSTGSPLPPEGFAWVYEHAMRDGWLFSTSGGTDVCTALVGGVPTLPVRSGELQARALGVRLEAWDERGRALTGAVGELVVTAPMPSMPVCLWGDADGTRLRDTYFNVYPGVWRHGDWIELREHGGAVIHGRSDATINRGGVRMGTSELYRPVLTHPDVVDALVVDVPQAMDASRLMLFVVLRDGVAESRDLGAQLKQLVREQCSPRHVPDEVRTVAEVPRTASGKALEIPVKRILAGEPPARVVNRGALANPAALDAFVSVAAELRATRADAPPAVR
jgi:acetoacetyl-CoA synthetase